MLIDRVSQEITSGNCVLFVGAGSTTEKWRQGPGFYSKIKEMTSLADESHPGFPEVMEKFCAERDNGHHNLLIREAISYLEPFCLSGPASRAASEFGRHVAAIPFFKIIVTTNWDPLLERALDVLVPITEDRDLAFWDDHRKQVLKLHGCITRPHSIVATQQDYEQCVRNNKILFNKLRDLMATKTFLFTGYSLRDDDFREIWDSITMTLGRFAKSAYALDPSASDEEIADWAKRGISIFRFNDVQFIQELRKHFVGARLVPADKLVAFLMRERGRVLRIHMSNNQDSDGELMSAMYQDGLLYALDDILDSIQLGTRTQEDFENDLGVTVNYVREARKAKDSIEIAYSSGRLIAISAFFEGEANELPTYFHPYKLTPISKLVKGRVWKRVPRLNKKPDG